MVTAAVLAGGRGARMGSVLPKQFLSVGGIPIIVRSILAFYSCAAVDSVVVAAGADCLDYTDKLIKEYVGGEKPVRLITGGATRSLTLKNIVDFCMEADSSDNHIILTHDAVRPFITEKIILDNIEGARHYGAVNTCVPCTDTIFMSSDGKFIDRTLDRSVLYHAQTPQTFNLKRLSELINGIPPEDFEKLTDGCSVFTYSGLPVFMADGDINNIKITYPQDMERAEEICRNLQR